MALVCIRLSSDMRWLCGLGIALGATEGTSNDMRGGSGDWPLATPARLPRLLLAASAPTSIEWRGRPPCGATTGGALGDGCWGCAMATRLARADRSAGVAASVAAALASTEGRAGTSPEAAREGVTGEASPADTPEAARSARTGGAVDGDLRTA